jgi:predicted nucleotidyltransferase component of viral defense system
MIRSSKQVKDLIRNMSKSDSNKAQLLIRNYGMERFLERISLSTYKDNFILKGGVLVSAMVGLDNRATMDIDMTVRNLPLDETHARRMAEEIAAVPVDDNIHFEIKDVSTIMDEAEYDGIRLSLDAILDTMRIPLKIDISTGDEITPAAIYYRYKLMLEKRYIFLWAYNLETVLAEKIETVLSRSTANTRLRDFYDIHILQKADIPIDANILAAALRATCHKRESTHILLRYTAILNELEANATMQKLWQIYQEKNSYAAGIVWSDVIAAVRILCDNCMNTDFKH